MEKLFNFQKHIDNFENMKRVFEKLPEVPKAIDRNVKDTMDHIFKDDIFETINNLNPFVPPAQGPSDYDEDEEFDYIWMQQLKEGADLDEINLFPEELRNIEKDRKERQSKHEEPAPAVVES